MERIRHEIPGRNRQDYGTEVRMTEPYWRYIGQDLLTQIHSADDLALLIVDLQMAHRKMAFERNEGRTINLSQPFGIRMNQNDETVSDD